MFAKFDSNLFNGRRGVGVAEEGQLSNGKLTRNSPGRLIRSRNQPNAVSSHRYCCREAFA